MGLHTGISCIMQRTWYSSHVLFPLPPMKIKALLPIFLVALIALVVVLDSQRRDAQRELRNLTVRMEQLQGNSEESREKAREVVESISRIYDLDVSVEPTVATIVDVQKLREQNPFYAKAENGDFLVVTATRAILYRESENRILDVVPVQLQPQEADDATQ